MTLGNNVGTKEYDAVLNGASTVSAIVQYVMFKFESSMAVCITYLIDMTEL